ncbi:MAG: RsmE family RNA methyltransferase [Candidatus Eisenbacteria bacterium]
MPAHSLDEGAWRLDTFVAPKGSLNGPTVEIEGAEHRHAFRSSRVRAGDEVRLIDGLGAEALARVESLSRDGATLSILEGRSHARDEGVSLTVVQAIPKGRGMDEVVRRCAELGVDTIVPVVTERCVSRPGGESARDRVERWRAVALAGVKQSRGVFLTNVEPPATLVDIGERVERSDRSVVAWEEESGVSLASVLVRPPAPRALLAVVGPEGGFSADEIVGLRALGVEPVGLGRRVLRSDWAAAALAAVASQMLGGLLP